MFHRDAVSFSMIPFRYKQSVVLESVDLPSPKASRENQLHEANFIV
jgi:hypothetical protein